MPARKLPPNEEVIAAYRSGASSGELAERYGVAPNTVRDCLERAGEPRRSDAEAAVLRVKRGRWTPPTYWKGRKQPPEMVERRVSKIRGPNHYLWKGGDARRSYRGKVEKVACDLCDARTRLGVHHKDFDHYNDDEDNLQVLCVSCHMSLHKQAWWDAVKRGEKPPVSNGPVGWESG